MAFLSFHWCFDEVSLLIAWWASEVCALLYGANDCRLRHVGWEKSGHGLTSRPRESASELFLDELLGLSRYPPRSSRALLAGTLPSTAALLGLPVRYPLGGYWCLVMFLACLLLILGLLMMVGLSLLLRGFGGLVVLDQDGKEFD